MLHYLSQIIFDNNTLLPDQKDNVLDFASSWRIDGDKCPPSEDISFADVSSASPSQIQAAEAVCAPIKNSVECIDENDRFLFFSISTKHVHWGYSTLPLYYLLGFDALILTKTETQRTNLIL